MLYVVGGFAEEVAVGIVLVKLEEGTNEVED